MRVLGDGGNIRRKPARQPAARADAKATGRPAGKAAGRALPRRVVAPVDASVRLGWQEAIRSTVSGLGYDLVDIERAQRGLLRITIDRQPGRVYTLRDGSTDAGEFITVDDCEQVTRQLQYALEVEGLDYARLEVSSPGLDRPLRTAADFERFAGQMVAITLKAPFQGRKSWQGLLQPAAPGAVAVVDEAAASAAQAPLSQADSAWSLVFKDGKTEQELGFTLAEVREARLVPVLNFKGRSAGTGPAAADGPSPDAQPGTAAAVPAGEAGEKDE